MQGESFSPCNTLSTEQVLPQTVLLPKNKETRKRIRKMINKIFAIPAAAPAIPAKPKIAAIIAITRKAKAKPNMSITSFVEGQKPLKFLPQQFLTLNLITPRSICKRSRAERIPAKVDPPTLPYFLFLRKGIPFKNHSLKRNRLFLGWRGCPMEA